MGALSGKIPNVANVDFTADHNPTAEIMFKVGPGYLKSVFGSDSKYWPQAMKHALGLNASSPTATPGTNYKGGFPLQLSTFSGRPPQTIPAVDFSENVQSHIGENLNNLQKICVTPTDFFTTQYSQIFKDTAKRLNST